MLCLFASVWIAAGTGCLICLPSLLARLACSPLPCPAPLLSSPSPSPVRHPGGSCRSLQDRGERPCPPCHLPPPPINPPGPIAPKPADRPTAIGRRSFSSAQDRTQATTSSPPPPARLARLSQQSGQTQSPVPSWGARKPGKWDTLPARALGSWNNTHPSPTPLPAGLSPLGDPSIQPPLLPCNILWRVSPLNALTGPMSCREMSRPTEDEPAWCLSYLAHQPIDRATFCYYSGRAGKHGVGGGRMGVV